MLAADVKILRQVEDVRYDDAQQRVAIIRIEFQVGRMGPFVERIDKTEFTKERRDETLNRFAEHVRV
jgi:hypothetical protein